MMRPSTKAPELKIKTTESDQWDLAQQTPDKYTMLVFYRGLHCPVCKTYLQTLNKEFDKFKEQGVTSMIAISGDTEEKAREAKKGWELTNLEIGFGQTTDQMKDWGLFISSSIQDEEPKYFGEPGLFLIDQNKELFYCATNSMPFGRPQFDDLIKALKFIDKENYPSRGQVSYDDV